MEATAQVENAIPRLAHERVPSSSNVRSSRLPYQVTRPSLASAPNELPPKSPATYVLSALCFPGEGRRWKALVRLTRPTLPASVHSPRSRSDFAQCA